MRYTSTRDKTIKISSATAITKGISDDGGLFVPTEIPKVSRDVIESLKSLKYSERATFLLSLFLTDYTEDELSSFVDKAYGGGKFGSEDVAPVKKLRDGVYSLELWHGPTCAFKDVALQLLPYTLTAGAKKTKSEKKLVILVATSGDTGKAALEGFKDVDGANIVVFYPDSGVSAMQCLQMQTQEGANVGVSAVRGNFDDAQTLVKKIFTDNAVKKEFFDKGFVFSSANSINWGRLVPQIVYYFSAYADLLNKGEIKKGDKINICVPTGNFGNILAAYYSLKMGLPVNKLICASNENNVLTDFINTGVYDSGRKFHTTISPSMDILISSNLERLIYHMSKGDDELVIRLYKELLETGTFKVPESLKKEIGEKFSAYYCDDDETKTTIGEVFRKYSYLCDTHTAVAFGVYKKYLAETGDGTPTVIASTASPFKFCKSVLEALGSEFDGDEFSALNELQNLTSVKAPYRLSSLKGKDIRFTGKCDPDEASMKKVISDFLGI